ncbi:DUF2283 domain-containing protein [bacterium]|nr:DUF2283 domain-containing protein [bacterium]
MKREIEIDRKNYYCDYDEYQDALFITFSKEPGLTYYEELDDGLMIRRDADTDEIVGYTIRNISMKICRQYLPKLFAA